MSDLGNCWYSYGYLQLYMYIYIYSDLAGLMWRSAVQSARIDWQ